MGRKINNLESRRINAINSNKEYLKKIGYSFRNEDDYIDQNTKLDIICDKGHTWNTTISNIRNNRRCPHCKDEERLNEVKKILDSNNYELVSNKWLGSKKKLDIICDKGHEIKMTPDSIKAGSKCKLCDNKIHNISQRLDYNDVKTVIEKRGYKLLSQTYVRNSDHLDMICPHGNPYSSTYINFQKGRGCNCEKESKGEKKICEILDKSNLQYERQKRFENCKYKYTLPFDFFVESLNLLIEFDGEQHFQKKFGMTDEEFNEIKERDKAKTKFCEDSNIFLLRIPYYDYDNISNILDKTLKERRSTTKFLQNP